MADARERSLAARIERELEQQGGINAVVEETREAIVLSGRVDTAEAKQAADDIAAALAGGKRIDNDLEVEAVSPQEVSNFYVGAAAAGDAPESVEELRDREAEVDADFTDQPLDTSGLPMSGVDTLEEGDTVYFPPTDPVITTDQRGNAQVLGGFTPTSTTSVEVERSASDGEFGDEAIADAIRRELREDAATTDLEIDVLVREGVVRLRGRVADVEDAENAEEVASRVPGVKEMVVELEVTSI